jgi:hypothetical protein
LNEEDINYLIRPTISNEIKAIRKTLPTEKSPELDGFTAKFYQTLKELPMLLKIFCKIGS